MTELRRWAERLREGDSQEGRAAARAILMLTEEVERLQAELRRRGETRAPDFFDQERSAPAEPEYEDDEPPDDEPPAPRGPAWLRRALGTEQGERPSWREPDEELSPRRLEARRRKRRRLRRTGLAVAALGALIFATFAVGAQIAAPDLHAQGPKGNALIGPKQLRRLAFTIRSGRSEVTKAHWRLDGLDVTGRVLVAGDTATFPARRLADGKHELNVSVDASFPGASSSHTWGFTVDTTPPQIGIPSEVQIQALQRIRLQGTVEQDAQLTIAGRPVEVKDGRFAVDLRSSPTRPVLFVARDQVGNSSRKRVSVLIVPRRPAAPLHAVHVTMDAWVTATLRDPVLQLASEGRIDAVELDVKDESGAIGWNIPLPLAHEAGAVRGIYNLRDAVRILHSKGVRVIVRIVAFRDPILAGWAWKKGHSDWVIQAPGGGPYVNGTYGAAPEFTNFANPAVRNYNAQIAVLSARAGADDILFDYIRRPDGPLSTMVFPGLKGSAEQGVASFVALVRRELPKTTYLGASVFGVAATRPQEVAQNIPMMARNLDYVAPMVYPSHWGPGEYGVADPNAQPYDIVNRSLKDFNIDVKGTGARVVPWLQDFSLGVTYGPTEVKAQIDAAHADGIDEFVLWSPSVVYDGAGLPAIQRPTTTLPTHTTPTATTPTTTPAVGANELGLVPVLEFHQIRDNPSSFDLTPDQFRSLIARVWQDGYYPIRAIDLVTGHIDVPAGKSPVVFTFDDSTNNQLKFLPDGSIDPNSAVGIMNAFATTHPAFHPTGTFFVLRDPFSGSGKPSNAVLQWLHLHGYELGNHTYDHYQLGTLSDTDVQKELVEGKRIIQGAIPGLQVRTMALPLGSYPKNTALAVSGSWGGESYHNEAVFLSGAEATPSPFSKSFNPANLPRIAALHDPSVKFGADWWLTLLENEKSRRYVSDGNPNKITFPNSELDQIPQRFSSQANSY